MQIQNKEFLNKFVKELILNSARQEITEAGKRYYFELRGAINREKNSFERIKEIQAKELAERRISEEQTVALVEDREKLREMVPSLAPEKDVFKMEVQNRPREIIEIDTTTKGIDKKIRPAIQKKFSIPLEKIETQKPLVRPILPFPVPSERVSEIEMGKLNPIISDPTVRSIECPGPNKFIVVRGVLGIKKANIKLNEKEIGSIINNFSEKTRIPVIKGVFRAISGNLTISAIISELAGSRFIIKKIQKRAEP